MPLNPTGCRPQSFSIASAVGATLCTAFPDGQPGHSHIQEPRTLLDFVHKQNQMFKTINILLENTDIQMMCYCWKGPAWEAQRFLLPSRAVQVWQCCLTADVLKEILLHQMKGNWNHSQSRGVSSTLPSGCLPRRVSCFILLREKKRLLKQAEVVLTLPLRPC